MAAVVDTDRVKAYKQQLGVLVVGGLTDPVTTSNQKDEETFTFEVPADASVVETGMVFRKKCKVTKFEFLPNAALAANGANYVTMLLQKRDGIGGAPVTVATIDTNSAGGNQSLAAFQATAGPPSTAAGVATVPAGQVLTFKSTETGTPVTPIGKVTVTVQYV